MSSEARHRAVRVAPALLSVVGAVYIVLVAVYSRPIADDWSFLPRAQHWGFGRYMGFYLGGSGRFSQFALAWLSGRLFGSAAVNVVPLALLALTLGLAAWLLRAVARLMTARVTWVEAVCLAVLAVVSGLAAAPSPYDTVGWFAAVVIYLAGPVTALTATAWVANRTRSRSRHPFLFAAALALIAAIAGGFDELMGASLTLAGLLAIITVRNLRRDDAPGPFTVPLGAITLGAAVGTVVNVFGPGSETRASAQGAHVSFAAAAHTAIENLSFLRADTHDAVLLLAVATGVVAWQLLGSVDGPRARGWIAVWALFLLIVPWVVTAALTAWGGSTESGGHSPFRAAFLPVGCVALAIMLIVWLMLSLYPALLSQTRATLLALALVAAGTVGIAHKADPMIRAELMRMHVLSARAVSIKRQLAAGRRTIELTPAPLLTVFTQAYDLSFVPFDQQRSGWVSALRQYYGIPAGDAVRITQQQPHDYCLPNVSASWVGVKSCQELAGASAAARSKG